MAINKFFILKAAKSTAFFSAKQGTSV